MTNPFDFLAVDLIVVVLSFGIVFLPINKDEVNYDLFSLKLHCYFSLLMHIISLQIRLISLLLI